MQFRGYIFRVNKKRGYFLVAFSSTMDAVRFCHAFQLMLMFIHWPAEGESFCGAQVCANRIAVREDQMIEN